MVQLSQKAKEELRAIFRAEFNQEITDEQAEEIGSDLLELLDLINRNASETPERR